jgi:hypothetical protein
LSSLAVRVDIEAILSHRLDHQIRNLRRAQFAPLQGRSLFIRVRTDCGRTAEFVRPVAEAAVDARSHAHAAQDRNANAFGAQILLEAFGQRDDAELGDAIRTQLPVRHETGETRGKQDVSAAPFRDHAWRERLDAMDRTSKVDADGPVPVGVRHGLRRAEHRHAGVVEKDIDPAKFASGPFGEGSD